MWHLLLLSLLSGDPVLASKIQNECAKGAEYWCSHFLMAVQCGALDYCVRSGWKQAATQGPRNRESHDDMCTDCKQLITLLTRMAEECSFKKAILNYLEHQCTNLPVQTLIPQCQALVKDYYARFFDTLEKQIIPGTLCAQLGACPSALQGPKDAMEVLLAGLQRFLPLLHGKALILPDSQTQDALPIPLPLCWLCRTFMGKLESVIPKETIGKAMSKLCGVLPAAIAGMCQCLMERYTVIIVDMIVSKLGPRLLCGMMFMCATEENCGPEDLPGLLPASAEGCRTCLTVSGQAKASLRANSSKGEVESALLTACHSPSLDWTKCNRFIHQHHPQLSVLLMKPWDSLTTCQELGVCAAEEPLPKSTACAKGPTYWCSSLSAAQQCKAVQHCQDHVWL